MNKIHGIVFYRSNEDRKIWVSTTYSHKGCHYRKSLPSKPFTKEEKEAFTDKNSQAFKDVQDSIAELDHLKQIADQLTKTFYGDSKS